MNEKMSVILSLNDDDWGIVKITENSCAINLRDKNNELTRQQAKQLVKVLDAFTHEWL